MKKLNVTLPLALAALACWLCLTLGVSRLLGEALRNRSLMPWPVAAAADN